MASNFQQLIGKGDVLSSSPGTSLPNFGEALPLQRLDSFAFGNVGYEGIHEAFTILAEQAQADFHRKLATVLAATVQIKPLPAPIGRVTAASMYFEN